MIRPELQHFAERMEYKLRANDHKPHWRGILPCYLLRRLRQELVELEDAMMDGGTPCQIADEAADVGNFAMMIADIVMLPCQESERGKHET